MQHFRDEDLEPQEVRAHLELNPLRAWYYHISSKFCTLVILLQVDPTFGDEPKTVYESCYETKTPPSLHGLQFSTLDTIIGFAIRFATASK
jgi:hypothetical protein